MYCFVNITGVSGQIAIVSTQSHKITSPELILGLADGTDMQISLSNCSNTLLSMVFDFPSGTVNYQLVGYDTNGILFQHSIEETATFPGSSCNVNECELETDNCHTNADCVDTYTGFLCICRLGYEGNGITCNSMPTLKNICGFIGYMLTFPQMLMNAVGEQTVAQQMHFAQIPREVFYARVVLVTLVMASYALVLY